jgi:formylglycine-generating enzyme required for sulfatase activity
MTWQPGTIVGGHYLIEKPLGEGGFGSTYLAKDKHNKMGLRVVLKKPKDDLLKIPKCIEDFKKEANFLDRLSKKRHPNIVRIIDFIDQESVPFLVMEYIEGDSLYQRVINQEKGLPERDAVRWIEQVGSALHCSHTGLEAPIIHRDANPFNIMISSDDCAILVDFGIARTVVPNFTLGLRNEAFAPWEQNSGRVHTTLDVYSLAASLYFSVTRQYPTLCSSRKMYEHSLPEPRHFNSTLSDRINNAILHGMALEPEDRPQTILEFLELLKEPVSSSTYVPVNSFESNKLHPVVQSTPSLSKAERPLVIKTVQPPLPQVAQQVTPNPNSPGVDWLSRILGQAPEVKEVVSPKQLPKNLTNSFRFETVTLNKNGKIETRKTYETQQFTEDLGNEIKIELVKIPGGSFLMGSPANEQYRSSDEGPQHRVQIPGFLMGKYAVTQAQWRRVSALSKVNIDLSADPSLFKGPNRPVEQVSWDQATEFCARLSRATNRAYRLPSESEWEYTCRAGKDTPFSFGPTLNPDVANYDGNHVYGKGTKGKYRRATTDVGSFPANGFGLYDMHGNVWEWCQDWWHDDYSKAPTDGSAQLNQQSDKLYRLLRGGSWDFNPWGCRSAARRRFAPDLRLDSIGFRVACSLAS